MSVKKQKSGKRYYTPAEANATLPLVSVILRDITGLATSLRDRQERLERLAADSDLGRLSPAYIEELSTLEETMAKDQGAMTDYLQELKGLGIELKDFYTGLVDFPAWMDGHEVYLCWRLGEPEVGHWHEIDAGFAGRQKLGTAVHSN